MAQKSLLNNKKELIEKSALTICDNCEHLVPKTMLCLYCGEPILYKMPKSLKEG